MEYEENYVALKEPIDIYRTPITPDFGDAGCIIDETDLIAKILLKQMS